MSKQTTNTEAQKISARNAPQIDANLSDSSPNVPSSLSSSPHPFPRLPFKSPRSLSISHFFLSIPLLHHHGILCSLPQRLWNVHESLCQPAVPPATTAIVTPPPFRLWNLLLQWLPGLPPLDYLPFGSALRDPHYSPTQ